MPVSELWTKNALDPPRACGEALATGTLRAQADDFIVEEDLGFAPAGSGQHVLLKITKRNTNTQWVARELARLCRCRPFDVGYAGLKDRRAVAIQWFTVPKTAQSLEAWTQIRGEGFEVLEAHAHTRKLPRGALAGNRFEIRIRDASVDHGQLAARIESIGNHGVPNYFGPQRFGRDGANLERICEGLRALRPQERGFVLSAARSIIFNAVLAERVRDGSWQQLQSGDLANLDSRGSIFAVDEVDATLRDRAATLDIHPTGPMWGRGSPDSRGRVLELETRLAGQFEPATALTQAAGMAQERRSLRLAVRELAWTSEAATIVMRFRLTRGSFATTVLREMFDFHGTQAELESEV
jgi:tRNA pseudouridine13 synthase